MVISQMICTVETLIEDVVENFQCILGQWTSSITAEQLGTRASRRTVGELLRIIYEKEALSDGASHVFVKENHTYRFAPFLMAHFPGCRFVLPGQRPARRCCIIRDH